MREGFTYTRREFLKKAGLAGGAMVMANVAGGIPSAAAAMEDGQGAADELLKGVCDIHIHAAPDVKGRCINEFDFACKAKDLGYRAVMYKSNEWSCHDRAYLIRQALPDFEVFGSFCMNYAVGDKINVHAAKMAVETTGLMPNAKRKMGTMTVPPPMPSNPDKIPIATPAIAGSTNIASTSIV